MGVPRLGIFGVNMGPDADALRRVVVLAEQGGYESVWTGEHIVLPDPRTPPSPAPPETPFLDTEVTLAHVAALTERIKLGTGIIILPQRQPAVLAKSLASLDQVSGGRLLFGLGVGYLEPEMTACSTPMARRGERADEYLRAMRALWSGDAVEFDGEFTRLDGVTANPKPHQPDLHTVVGGHSDRAARRAVELAHGWYGFMRDLDDTAEDLARLRRAAARYERPERFGRLEVSITPKRTPAPADLEAYHDLGVDRLILQPGWHRGLDGVLAYIERFAPAA
jgi:probable F420-dependent oxidoreductase